MPWLQVLDSSPATNDSITRWFAGGKEGQQGGAAQPKVLHQRGKKKTTSANLRTLGVASVLRSRKYSSPPQNVWKTAQNICVNDTKKQIKHFLYLCHRIQSRLKNKKKLNNDLKSFARPKKKFAFYPFSPILKTMQLFFFFLHLTSGNTQTLPAHVARLSGEHSGIVSEPAEPRKRAESVKSYQMFGRSIKQDPTRFGETERGANPGNQKCWVHWWPVWESHQ